MTLKADDFNFEEKEPKDKEETTNKEILDENHPLAVKSRKEDDGLNYKIGWVAFILAIVLCGLVALLYSTGQLTQQKGVTENSGKVQVEYQTKEGIVIEEEEIIENDDDELGIEIVPEESAETGED